MTTELMRELKEVQFSCTSPTSTSLIDHQPSMLTPAGIGGRAIDRCSPHLRDPLRAKSLNPVLLSQPNKPKSTPSSSPKPKKPSSDKKPVGLTVSPASSQRYLLGDDSNSDDFSEITERAAPRGSSVSLNEPSRFQSSKLEGLTVVSPYEAPSRIQSVLKVEDAVAARPSSSSYLASADIRSQEQPQVVVLRALKLNSHLPIFCSPPPPRGEMMPGGGSGYSNGYTRYEPQKETRIRRGRGGARDYRGGWGGSGSGGLSRVSPSASPSSSSVQVDRLLSSPQWAAFDSAYFQSYSHVGIHEEMIKDHVRTDAYRNAIMRHQNLISGKVVIDVGCGTGILSIFCALAGARRVYAVEASDIAVQAQEVVRANNLSDRVIVLHGRVEDVNIEEKVDVIISEWMGYMLLYESMLGSVIFARDKWLKPRGLILPSHATLYLAPVTHSERYSESIDFWRNVYGIDMSAMLPLAKQCAFEEPSVETITGENVLTWPHVVKYVDCYTVIAQELESITTRYRFESMMRAPLHGFAFWFDVEFNGPAMLPNNNVSDVPSHDSSQAKKREVIVLSTAPEDEPTHWQQTLLYFYDPIDMEQDQVIEGSVNVSQSQENPRFLNIHLEYSSGGRSFVKQSVMR